MADSVIAGNYSSAMFMKRCNGESLEKLLRYAQLSQSTVGFESITAPAYDIAESCWNVQREYFGS